MTNKQGVGKRGGRGQTEMEQRVKINEGQFLLKLGCLAPPFVFNFGMFYSL